MCLCMSVSVSVSLPVYASVCVWKCMYVMMTTCITSLEGDVSQSSAMSGVMTRTILLA